MGLGISCHKMMNKDEEFQPDMDHSPLTKLKPNIPNQSWNYMDYPEHFTSVEHISLE